MTDAQPQTDAARIEALVRENAKLQGESLATAILLTQLLQAICKTQMNPYAYATRIMNDARSAVDAFNPPDSPAQLPAMKSRALEMIKHYDEQIRSVLPV